MPCINWAKQNIIEKISLSTLQRRPYVVKNRYSLWLRLHPTKWTIFIISMRKFILLAITISCVLAAATPCNGSHPYTLSGQCYIRTPPITKSAHGKRPPSTSAMTQPIRAKAAVPRHTSHSMGTTAASRSVPPRPTQLIMTILIGNAWMSAQ